MKTLPLFFVAVVMMLFTATTHAQTTQQTLTEAQQAYLRGDTEVAKEKFKLVLEMDPQNVTAVNYLRMIQTHEKGEGKEGELEKQLQELVLPRVELNDATFGTALEYLKQSAAKASGGKVAANFVVQVPSSVTDTTKVTLNLTKVPFTEVMRYVGELTGFKFTVEKYAIMVKQGTAAPAAAASASPDGSKQ